MTAVVFVGPTIGAGDAGEILPAEYRGPAAQGDVYRAARGGCTAIGIVDGFFHAVPSVWHKEVLWALDRGVHVYGGASMGALRAAELHAFGMVGVGEVFEAFRSGELEDDDEVAVLHRNEGEDFGALSEAMVNVRATLRAAVANGVVSAVAGERLTAAAKDLPYGERRFERILAAGRAGGVDEAGLDRLRAWLPGGRKDQKRQDAVAMLRAMAAADLERPRPRPDWRFERTTMWDRLVHDVASEGASAEEEVLAELLLDPPLLALATEAAAARHHRLEEASRRGLEPGEDEVRASEAAFRRLHALADAGLAAWLRANDLGREAFARLMADEARLAAVRRHLHDGERSQLADWLRAAGHYGRLAAAAAAKSTDLAAAGLDEPTPDAAGVELPELLTWFFRRRVAGTEANPVGLDAVMRVAREEPDAFRRAILREYCHRQLPRSDAD